MQNQDFEIYNLLEQSAKAYCNALERVNRMKQAKRTLYKSMKALHKFDAEDEPEFQGKFSNPHHIQRMYRDLGFDWEFINCTDLDTSGSPTKSSPKLKLNNSGSNIKYTSGQKKFDSSPTASAIMNEYKKHEKTVKNHKNDKANKALAMVRAQKIL